MKSRFALLAVMCVAAAPLAAQGGGRQGGGMGGMNIDQLTTMYTLTPEQVTKTNELLKVYTTKTAGVQAWMTKLRESGDMQAMRSAPGFADSMKVTSDARAAFDAEFKKVLTGAQVAKFDSVAAARAARMQRPQGQ